MAPHPPPPPHPAHPPHNETATQKEVLAFLGDPATHGGQQVKRMDTHIAAVFLVGERALKVKRAVRFPFLDFSTLARRKDACLAELEANRPFAANLYRGVVAITREADGRLAIGGEGEPVEWAVEMRRFDETRTLDRIARRKGIDLGFADRLARSIAAAHARAHVVEDAPWIAALANYIEQNNEAFADYPELFPPPQLDALTTMSFAALRKVRPLLMVRGGLGLVRRGHGDLHLGNIAVIAGKPVPFDALEFDPVVAAGDVLYDLAFLLMDMVERDLLAAANVVLNRYLAETWRIEDYDGLAALPLFLSLRAAIRAKVTAARPAEGEEAVQVRETAKRYFQLARRLITPPQPVLIAIGGLSGSGKSILSRALAPYIEPVPGAVVLRSDTKRKAIFGLVETTPLPAEAYRPEVTDYIYTTLMDEVCHPLKAGHSAIVDAVFAKPQQRLSFEAAAELSGVRFIGLFLTTDQETRVERVRGRVHDASDANEALALRQESYDLGEMTWTMIDASGTPEETLALVRDHLAQVIPSSPFV